MADRIKILTCSTLYPNAATPHHGIFVENRLRATAALGESDFRVAAPVPWFPFKQTLFAPYDAFARVPRSEMRHGFFIDHPRYLIPPKIGMTYAASALERCFYAAARRAEDDGFAADLIDAHYLYPDGVAAGRAARRLGKPFVLTARGSDVSQLANFPRQRAMILEAIFAADHVICVAAALRDALIDMGAPEGKLHVFRNGVDLRTFQPQDKRLAREKLGLRGGPVIASVGHLIERKGHDIVIDAIAQMPGAELVVAGDGPLRIALQKQAAMRGVADRTHFLGAVPHDELPAIYSAADILALASSREGWPNVLLEAMACGTPAVAAPVWGCAEVIRSPEAGRLTDHRRPECFAAAFRDLLAEAPSPLTVRRYAEGFSWDETAQNVQSIFTRTLEKSVARSRVVTTGAAPSIIPGKPFRPKLIVTVDTEEQFDWSSFTARDYRICPPENMTPFQILCEPFGVEPLYFLTHALLVDGPTANYFRALKDAGRACCGIHCHQWATPPFGDYEGAYYSFQKNLPGEAYRKKLIRLADQFKEVFGETARHHRAGRYGVDPLSYDALAEIGVTMDYSPSPGFDQRRQGGPDHIDFSNKPFAITPPGRYPITVIPVCGARAIKKTTYFLDQEAPLDERWRRTTAPMRLTPEGSTITILKNITSRLLKSETPILTFSIHSTTLTPGANAYGTSTPAIEKTLHLTKSYFEFFRDELGGEFVNAQTLESLYGAATITDTAPARLVAEAP